MRKCWHQGGNSPPAPRRKSSSPGHWLSLHIHIVSFLGDVTAQGLSQHRLVTPRGLGAGIYLCIFKRGWMEKDIVFSTCLIQLLVSANYSKSSRITQLRTTTKTKNLKEICITSDKMHIQRLWRQSHLCVPSHYSVLSNRDSSRQISVKMCFFKETSLQWAQKKRKKSDDPGCLIPGRKNGRMDPPSILDWHK